MSKNYDNVQLLKHNGIDVSSNYGLFEFKFYKL